MIMITADSRKSGMGDTNDELLGFDTDLAADRTIVLCSAARSKSKFLGMNPGTAPRLERGQRGNIVIARVRGQSVHWRLPRNGQCYVVV